MLEVTVGAQRDRFALVGGGDALSGLRVAVLIQDLLVMPLAYQLGGEFGGSRRIAGSGGVAAGAAGQGQRKQSQGGPGAEEETRHMNLQEFGLNDALGV